MTHTPFGATLPPMNSLTADRLAVMHVVPTEGLIWHAGPYDLTYELRRGADDETPVAVAVKWWRSRGESPREHEADIRRHGDDFSFENWAPSRVPTEVDSFLVEVVADALGGL